MRPSLVSSDRVPPGIVENVEPRGRGRPRLRGVLGCLHAPTSGLTPQVSLNIADDRRVWAPLPPTARLATSPPGLAVAPPCLPARLWATE